MTEYPPEVQAVLDAAVALRLNSGHGSDSIWNALLDAVDAYRKATAPPEPFERYIYRYTDGTWSTTSYEDVDDTGDIVNTWRCIVTPVERVR